MVEGSVLEVTGTDLKVDPFEDSKTCKIMLAEPSSGFVDSIVHDNRLDFYMELARLESRSNFKFFTGNVHRLHVSYARELICHEAMERGMDYLFMTDDDMIIPKRCFERLFKTMKETGADIISPMCTQRLPPYNPVLYRCDVNQDEKGNKTFKNDFVKDYEPNSIVELDAVGFGVVLINLSIIKKLKKPLFFSNTNIGEDIWFCFRAKRELGAKVFCDTKIKVGHMKYPSMATEYDWVKENKLLEKFKGVYGHLNGKVESIDDLNENNRTGLNC